MRKKKTFEYTSYFAAEFNGFLQYRISGGSNGLEERRVLKSLDDYLTLGSKGHLFEQFSGEKMQKI